MAATLLAMAQTRLELLGNEVEVEKLRLLRMLLLAQALMFTALVAVLLSVSFLTLWLWEFRLGVLALCIALFSGLRLVGLSVTDADGATSRIRLRKLADRTAGRPAPPEGSLRTCNNA